MRLLPVVAVSIATTVSLSAQQWPSFRGAERRRRRRRQADAGRRGTRPTGENVLWKTPIPGVAVSSPIVWGDRVFVSTAVSSDPNVGIRTGLYGDVEPVADHVAAHVAADRARQAVRQGAVGSRGPSRVYRRRSGIRSRARRRRRRSPTGST